MILSIFDHLRLFYSEFEHCHIFVYFSFAIDDCFVHIRYYFTIFNLVKYALLVPLVFRCRLARPIVIIALGYYAIYQIVYLLAVLGKLGS